jgi:hypothetical protein
MAGTGRPPPCVVQTLLFFVCPHSWRPGGFCTCQTTLLAMRRNVILDIYCKGERAQLLNASGH